MGYYKELNDKEVEKLEVGDKVMVNSVKTSIVEVQTGNAGTIGFFTEAFLYHRPYARDCHFWGKNTSSFTVHKLTGETIMKTKQFTKADLKTGHRVTTRNGDTWTVLLNVPTQNGSVKRGEPEGILAQEMGWMPIGGLDDNLIYTTNTQYSIEKVELVEFYMNYLDKDARKVVIWEREAPKSKEQIAYDEAVEATEAARQAYELAQKKLEALNPANK